METKTSEMKKIVFTGPECCGKTTLSSLLSNKLKAPLVKEYAREYLSQINRKYKYDDLLIIAKKQISNEITKQENKKLIICDTNIQVIKIWSLIKFNKCDKWIIANEDRNAYYFLCHPAGIKWEEDPLREDKKNRARIFDIYQSDLVKTKANFTVLRGSIKQRINMVISTLQNNGILKKI